MEFEAAVAAAAPPASSRLPFTEIVCDPNTFEQDIYIDDDDMLDATDQLPPAASSAALTANMLQLQQLQQQQQRIGLHHSFHVPSSPPHHRTFPNNNTSNHNTNHNSNPQANFRRKLPSHSQSADCFTLGRSSHSNHNRPLQRRGVLKREAQASYGPGGQQQPLPRHSFSQHTTSGGVSRAGHSHDASMNGLSSFADTNASNANETSGVMTGTTSIPSTHLAVQYMQGMRRLSRSIRQTEMTRSALRRSLRSTPSAQSLPPEMTQVSSYGSGSITENNNNNNGVGVGGMVDPTTTSPKNHHHLTVAAQSPQQPHVPVPHCSPSSNTQLLEDDTRHQVLSLAYHQPWTTDNNHGHHHPHHAVPEDVIPEDMLDDDDDDDNNNDKVQEVRQDVPPRGVARITSFHSPVQQASPPQMVEYSMAEVSSPRMAAAPTMSNNNNNGFPSSSPKRGQLLNHHSGPVFGVAATSSSSMMQT